MKHRMVNIEVTKAYVDAFNRRDMVTMENMLDGADTVFSRQGQPTIVGAHQIMSRTRKTWRRLDRQGKQLHMVNGIVDIKGEMARPCILGMLDGARYSLVLLDCKANGQISVVTILLGADVVAKIRPTEPCAPAKIQELHDMKPALSNAEVSERQQEIRRQKRKIKNIMAQYPDKEEMHRELRRWYLDEQKLKALTGAKKNEDAK